MHPPGSITMNPNNPAVLPQPHEVIEIDSDSDSDDEVVQIPRPPPVRPTTRSPPPPPQPTFQEQMLSEDDYTAFFAELEGVHDAQLPAGMNQRPISPAPQPEAVRPVTMDECLAKVLEIYPDISHDHVRNMFRGGLETGMQADSTWCEQLIVRILDEGTYPKEREAKQAALKRKREPSEDEFDHDPMRRGPYTVRRAYQGVAANVLQNEYPEIPVKFIEKTLRTQASFFKAFLMLAEAEHTYSETDPVKRPYRKVRRRDPKPLNNPNPSVPVEMFSEAMEKVTKELSGAKKKASEILSKRQEEEERRLEEERNQAIARSNNQMTECLCCFDQFPQNRMTFCNGAKVHFYCHECACNWVSSELGNNKCHPKCFGTEDCGAEITPAELRSFLDPEVLKRLERMQQQEAIRNAGIPNLVECPFCDFAAECAPVEIDREFRCENDDCKIISCRLCQKESHTPKTCEEAVRDRKGNARHQVEEAMTNALIRSCNKCKTPFYKLEGCNKMTCGKCGNTQCYICSKNVQNYDHFHASGGKCPLYDNNVEKRHQDEVRAAEAAALETVGNKNPDMTEDELKVRVSSRIQQEEQNRVAAGERGRPGHPNHPILVPPGQPPRHWVPPPRPPVLPRAVEELDFGLGRFGGLRGIFVQPRYAVHNPAAFQPAPAPAVQRNVYNGPAAAYGANIQPVPAPPANIDQRLGDRYPNINALQREQFRRRREQLWLQQQQLQQEREQLQQRMQQLQDQNDQLDGRQGRRPPWRPFF